MNSTERVKLLCKERKIPVSRLEKECNFANGYIGQLKKELPLDRAQKIADFFNVDLNYLLGLQETSSFEFKANTIAAHLDTHDLTETELEDVADYIEYIRNKRNK